MRDSLRAAMVIARRDYVASVWSRTFILFLLGPLFPVVIGMFFGNVGADIDRKATQLRVAVIADAREGDAIEAAYGALASRLGSQMLPAIRVIAPEADVQAQTGALLRSESSGISAVVRGGLAHPLLVGPRRVLFQDRNSIALILDEARRRIALEDAAGTIPQPVTLDLRPVDQVVANDSAARILTARLGQLILMMLTMILAGMLLSNLIEEKSNKVIEVLAAAVPVDAIFFGKLVAMLAMSLTGIAVWASAAGLAIATLLPPGSLPVPAVGWPAYLALGVVYFIGCYLLLGALFIGIGAHASTVREVQTLSMPVTMAQLGVVALASTAVADPNGPVGMGAMLFPWSSPFAMFARAALLPDIWPHLLAILWQALWIGLIVRVAARRFRKSVLKSGGPPRRGLFAWRRKGDIAAG